MRIRHKYEIKWDNAYLVGTINGNYINIHECIYSSNYIKQQMIRQQRELVKSTSVLGDLNTFFSDMIDKAEQNQAKKI